MKKNNTVLKLCWESSSCQTCFFDRRYGNLWSGPPGGPCYYKIDRHRRGERNWDAANARCRQMGAILAQPDRYEEFLYISDHMKSRKVPHSKNEDKVQEKLLHHRVEQMGKAPSWFPGYPSNLTQFDSWDLTFWIPDCDFLIVSQNLWLKRNFSSQKRSTKNAFPLSFSKKKP